MPEFSQRPEDLAIEEDEEAEGYEANDNDPRDELVVKAEAVALVQVDLFRVCARRLAGLCNFFDVVIVVDFVALVQVKLFCKRSFRLVRVYWNPTRVDQAAL